MITQELVSGEELGRSLGISRTTIWRLRQQGMPSKRLGRSVRYPLPEVLEWLESSQGAQLRFFERASEYSTSANGSNLLPCAWSPAVALDPKHRPQTPHSPSSTVRMEWRRYPQEAHLLDLPNRRYRRFAPEEVGSLQGFPTGWASDVGLTDRERIAGFGNAVPPPLARAIFAALRDFIPGGVSRYLEICAGFGGLAIGAHEALGAEPMALLDFWDAAVRVLRAAGPWSPERVHLADVKTFDFSRYSDGLDVLCGGPPCQPWSQGGRSRGEQDERDVLGHTPRLIAQLQPRAFIFENVPGLLSGEHREYAENLVRELRNAAGTDSYGVALAIFQAADYGVPQDRRRVIIAGIRGATTADLHAYFDVVYSLRSHSTPRRAIPHGLKPWVTIAKAIPEWQHASEPWRRWIDDGSSTASKEAKQAMNSDSGKAPLPPELTSSSRAPRIGLTWPGRDQRPVWHEHTWSIVGADEAPTGQVRPLLASDTEASGRSPRAWYVRGDQIATLESLRSTFGRRVRLVYFEAPRIATDQVEFAAASSEERLNTWLAVVQATARRALGLLRDDGVLVILCGVAEQPYIQVLLDETIGADNRVGTIVWQKGYSAQNTENMNFVYETHDYLLAYSKRREECIGRIALKVPAEGFANPDGDPRGDWKAEHKGANYKRPSCDFMINIPPYRWDVAAGALPPGVWRVSPKSGVIWAPEGAISQPGEYAFTVRVADSAGASAKRQLIIRVLEECGAPTPAPPPWLIAELDENGRSLNAPTAGGPLRVATTRLPDAKVGAPYFACLEAKGGAPFSDTTRPGKTSTGGEGRYWDFSNATFLEAAAADQVDYKSKDDAIPAIKIYAEAEAITKLNQMSTWLGAGKASAKEKDPLRVGYGQEGKGELEELRSQGVITRVLNISKPARLMCRLLALFSSDEDVVVDIGSPAAEMAALALATGRRAIYVETPDGEDVADSIKLPRLRLAARGGHPIPDGVLFHEERAKSLLKGYFIGDRRPAPTPESRVSVLELGPPFAQVDEVAGVAALEYSAYPAGSARFLEALASVEGLLPLSADSPAFAQSLDGTLLAIHVPGATVLDGRTYEKLKETFRAHLLVPRNCIRVYFHRGYDQVAEEGDPRFQLRRVPFDLRLSGGTL